MIYEKNYNFDDVYQYRTDCVDYFVHRQINLKKRIAHFIKADGRRLSFTKSVRFVLFCFVLYFWGGGYFSMNKVNAYNSILAKICSILKIDIIFYHT